VVVMGHMAEFVGDHASELVGILRAHHKPLNK
jgi:hypothetical protein